MLDVPQQSEAVRAAYLSTKRNDPESALGCVLSVCTGGGKTVIGCCIAMSDLRFGPVLVVCHTAAILENWVQFLEGTFGKRYVRERVAVLSAGLASAYPKKTHPHMHLSGEEAARRDVVIASRQTLYKRMTLPDDHPKAYRIPKYLSAIHIDEAHQTSLKVEEYGLICKTAAKVSPKALRRGYSATPWRGKSEPIWCIDKDERDVDKFFDDLVWETSIRQGIESKRIVPLVSRGRVKKSQKIDVSKLVARNIEGDYSEGEIEETLLTAGKLAGAADTMLQVMDENKGKVRWDGNKYKIVPSRAAIVFTSGVESARRFAEILNRKSKQAIAACYLGETTEKEKKDLRDRLSDPEDELRVLVSVAAIVEGFDVPQADLCVLLRPTRLFKVLVQMSGRVCRSYPGKEYGGILDFCGNVERLGKVDQEVNWKNRVPGVPMEDWLPGAEGKNWTCTNPKCGWPHNPVHLKACAKCGEEKAEVSLSNEAPLSSRVATLPDGSSVMEIRNVDILSLSNRDGFPYLGIVVDPSDGTRLAWRSADPKQRATQWKGRAIHQYLRACGVSDVDGAIDAICAEWERKPPHSTKGVAFPRISDWKSQYGNKTPDMVLVRKPKNPDYPRLEQLAWRNADTGLWYSNANSGIPPGGVSIPGIPEPDKADAKDPDSEGAKWERILRNAAELR